MNGYALQHISVPMIVMAQGGGVHAMQTRSTPVPPLQRGVCRPKSSNSLDNGNGYAYALLARRLGKGHCTVCASSRGVIGMTKAELVDQVAATVQLPKSQIDAVLTQFLQSIMAALQAGETPEIRGRVRFWL